MRTSIRTQLWLPALVILLSAAVYLPTLRYAFVMDDTEQVVDNRAHLNWESLPSYFTTDVWGSINTRKSNYYRPMFMTWLMLNSELWGTDPLLWHVSTLLVHLLCTLLFYLLARRLLESALLAALAALIFGVHPAHVESVVWVSGVTEPLFGAFALGTLLMHLRGGLWRIGAMVCLTLALFVKETAVVLPLLLAGCEWAFAEAPTRVARLRAAGRAVAPYLIPLALYLPMRWHALGNMAPLGFGWRVSQWIYSLPAALAFYLQHLMWPFPNSIFYPLRAVDSWSVGGVLVPCLVLAAAGWVVYSVARGSREAVFGAVLLVLPLLPLLDLPAFRKTDFVHDRYLYLPVAGFCLLAAVGVRQVKRHGAILLGFGGLMAVFTILASPIWRDNMTLYTQAVRVAPESERAQALYGSELMQRGQFADALIPLKAALAGEPDEEGNILYLNIANCYQQLGEAAEAANYLHDAQQVAPQSAGVFAVSAVFELKWQHLDLAEAAIRQALRLRPRGGAPYTSYHSTLGRILEGKGEWKAALAEYEAELRENPGSPASLERAAELRRRAVGQGGVTP